MKRLACAVAICLVTATAFGARAGTADPADWQRRIAEARAVVAQAQLREASAEKTYDEMRARAYPRGAAKLAIEAERTAARDDLTRAQGDLEALLEQARREGVPPGVLRATEGSVAVRDASATEAARAADLPDEAPTADDDTERARPADIPVETPAEN